MFPDGPRILSGLCLAVLLQACASTPGPVEPPAGETQPEPELTLNLPRQAQCACEEERADFTFLEKGLSALVAGDHIEAVDYFQRYQRIESSPLANWEAAIAIAYDSMLPQSPHYDPKAAREAYAALRDLKVAQEDAHEQVLIMRDALQTFVALEQQIGNLQVDNALLRENLAKREEAIKRLRELTLGQKEESP